MKSRFLLRLHSADESLIHQGLLPTTSFSTRAELVKAALHFFESVCVAVLRSRAVVSFVRDELKEPLDFQIATALRDDVMDQSAPGPKTFELLLSLEDRRIIQNLLALNIASNSSEVIRMAIRLHQFFVGRMVDGWLPQLSDSSQIALTVPGLGYSRINASRLQSTITDPSAPQGKQRSTVHEDIGIHVYE